MLVLAIAFNDLKDLLWWSRRLEALPIPVTGTSANVGQRNGREVHLLRMLIAFLHELLVAIEAQFQKVARTGIGNAIALSSPRLLAVSYALDAYPYQGGPVLDAGLEPRMIKSLLVAPLRPRGVDSCIRESTEEERYPRGWVYLIAGSFGHDDEVPAEAIIGAWRVDHLGKVVGKFVRNQRVGATSLKKRKPIRIRLTLRSIVKRLTRREPASSVTRPANHSSVH
jgi:hypothetical protein